METNSKSALHEIAAACIILFLSIYFLSSGKDLLIPFVIAMVLWYLTIAFANALRRLPYCSGYLTEKLALMSSILIGVGLFIVILYMLSKNIYNVIYYIPKYQANLSKMVQGTLAKFNIQSVSVAKGLSLFEKNDFITWLSRAAQTLTDIISLTGIILIYYMFLLFETSSLNKKVDALFKDNRKRTKTRQVIGTINSKLQSYLWIKTVLSLLTGFSSYLVLHLVSVDFSEFWGCLIFLLNYIPTFGSIIATVFPCLLSIIQFESWIPFLIITLGLTTIQFIIGNIMEPKIMGGSFNLSGIIILLSLVLWGKLWGITGMFLCVPFTVMAYIIFSQFERTRWIAILLSADGKTL